jgi:hypothetical protein
MPLLIEACNLFSSSFPKEKLKEQELSTPKEIIEVMAVIWGCPDH